MAPARRTMTHAEARRLLRRVGLKPGAIEDLLADLPDPIDLDHTEALFERSGITAERLMDLLGGSP